MAKVGNLKAINKQEKALKISRSKLEDAMKQ